MIWCLSFRGNVTFHLLIFLNDGFVSRLLFLDVYFPFTLSFLFRNAFHSVTFSSTTCLKLHAYFAAQAVHFSSNHLDQSIKVYSAFKQTIIIILIYL